MKHTDIALDPSIKKSKVYNLELNTYLEQVQEKADKISDKFVAMFFVLGLCLMPVYETWAFTIANSVIIAGLYGMARLVIQNKFRARMIISLVYAIFMLQFIGQMHGMAEIHFFFFINIALLIIYQDWRIMIPYTVFAIGHHSVLAVLQANAANIDVLQGVNLGNYFIGFQGRTIEGATVDYITTFQLMFHFGLAAMMAFICGWWAVIFRNNSINLMEKQFEAQAQNEELRSSEEELRQNTEELQSTNDQMYVIQREIEEKQKLLNKAEKLVNLASYEIDLATQKLTHSDNLPTIYGENKLDDMQKVIEIAHPEDTHKVVDTISQSAAGKIEDYDISYRSKGNNFDDYKYYRAVGELVRDGMNNPEKLVGTVQDITDEVKQKQKIEEAYQKVQSSEEELQQNYEELQAIQEQLLLIQYLIDNSQDAIQASKADGQFVYMNKVAGERFGIRSEECSNYYVHQVEAVFNNQEDWKAHVEEVKQIGGITIESQVTNEVTKETFPVEVGVRYVDINGEGYMMASSRNITERKKAEQELQTSEEELRQNYEELQTTQELVNNAFSEIDAQLTAISTTLGYVEMNTDRKVERVNQLFADWTGYSIDELQGAKHIDFVPNTEEDKQKYEQLWEKLNAGETVSEVFKRKAKDGTEVWLYGAYCPVKDKEGKVVKIIKVASNYNAHKEFEEQIKSTNDRLQNLIENVGDLVFLLDTDLVFKQYYASSDKDLVLKPESFLHRKITEVGFPNKPLKNIVAALQKAILNKEKATAEYKLELPHGNEWFSLIASPILNGQTEVEDILCVTRNITYIKETEIAVQEQNEMLSQQKENIETAFNELKTTQDQLIQSEKMASLGQLVANIAHEINTPLGAIRSSALSIDEILENTLPTLPPIMKSLDDATLDSFNRFVQQSSQKTDMLSSREKRRIKYNLIGELEAENVDKAEEYADWIVDMNMHEEKELYFSFLKTQNSREILHTAYQLSTVVRSNRTVKTATDRAAKIVFALKNYARQDQTGEKSTVNINESLETTLTLYHNQIKHGVDVTRDFGGIPEFMGYPDELVQVWTNIIHNALQAMKHKGRLFLQTSTNDDKVLVSIQDTGGGIPKEVQDKIFDAFFTTKSAGEGSGLGLDITKKIIEKHDGKIWFDSLDGVGTTFFIELPIKNEN
ncbi:PAS domain S-box protein [Bernardetia sp. ABR2-2B]|uniref:PAS domain-containing sensor histidine kinase n=1 Tax=Bernardetia sp. ABR2-2B TaxID=3127472 RepID=UPI0030CDCC1F